MDPATPACDLSSCVRLIVYVWGRYQTGLEEAEVMAVFWGF